MLESVILIVEVLQVFDVTISKGHLLLELTVCKFDDEYILLDVLYL